MHVISAASILDLVLGLIVQHPERQRKEGRANIKPQCKFN